MNKRLRKKRGIYTKFKDKETYSLDYTIACFVLPRLKRFKELDKGCPSIFFFNEDGSTHFNDEGRTESAHQEWQDILDCMIYSFEQIVNNPMGPDYDYPNESFEDYSIRYKMWQNSIQEGLDYFAKYFMNLWW